MNSNQVETLVTLANYFRGAMMDELQLPEKAATMPQIVQVNGFKMMKVTDKAKHYKDVVEEIEKSLEAYALQLNALMPKSIDTQKKIEFKDKTQTTEKKEEKKVEDKKEVVVDAETNLSVKETKEDTNIKKFLIRKDSDESKPIYGSLTVIPKTGFKPEDQEALISAWKKSKGPEEKAKVYNKMQEILNNYKMPVALLRNDISKFINKQHQQQKQENLDQFDKEIKEAGITYDTTTDLNKIRSGKELTSGKLKWVDKEGNFNIALLTDGKTEDDVDPQNFVKLWAMQLRTAGNERLAIDIITKFYSDAKTGTIWSPEKARYFLNNLFRVNQHKELMYLIENMLITKHEQGDHTKAYPFIKSFLINYTKSVKEVEKVIDGKKQKVKEETYWPMHKIENLIKRAESGLRMVKLLKHEDNKKKLVNPKFEVTYTLDKKGEYMGTVKGLQANVNISAYPTLEGFKKACKMVALNQARFNNPDFKEEDLVINYTEEKASASQEGSKKSTFQTSSTKDKVVVPTKSTAVNSAKKKENTDKTVKIVKNSDSKDSKNTGKGNNTQNQNKGLKTSKNASQGASKGADKGNTKSNVKTEKMPPAKQNDKPQYSAIITLEKDKTYTCVINGFNEVIKTTGAKTVEDAKADFIEALRKYNEKVAEENDKARASFKKGKGKMLHMKPDFTKGELTFLLKGTGKKTGTNG